MEFRKNVSYDITISEYDLKILIDCIENSKLENLRHQSMAWDLAKDFKKMIGIEDEE